MARTARRLATLLPAMLCAIWSLLVLPAPTAQATGSTASTASTVLMSDDTAHRPARAVVMSATAPAVTDTPAPAPSSPPGAPAPLSPHGAPPPGAPHRAASPEPHFAPTAVVRLPAAVENPVRFPGTPVTTAAVPADLVLPARGVLAGDPRRERAPPGAAHGPRAPRGPPATRHS
ncbi:hypothetical protein OHB11_36995 [Streptomyces zaomyceticus]|uniref:Secreted protein n=1 Tax=Streptomyces zaomyceticus TaxID=68286 RepID=A0ABZ1LJS5_9ACTN|nr:hypothetical protein OG237_02880 [Streptomyces zaomyceticus]